MDPSVDGCRSAASRTAIGGGVSSTTCWCYCVDVSRPVASPYVTIGAALLLAVLCRLARTWNQTGDKWAHLPDVADWLLRQALYVLLCPRCKGEGVYSDIAIPVSVCPSTRHAAALGCRARWL